MTLFTLALLCLAQPVVVEAQDPTAKAPAYVTAAEPVDRALQGLASAVASHASLRPAFEALRSALEAEARAHVDDARATELKDRLLAIVDDFANRAESSLFDADACARLAEDVLDARAERAIAWLESCAAERRPTRAQFDAVAKLFESRLERAHSTPEEEAAGRERWRTFAEALRSRVDGNATTAADFSELRAELVASRLERALGWLEARALARSASRLDYTRVRSALEDRAKLAGASFAPEELERLQNALTKLEERAQAADITREEFRAVATKLIGKAREAASSRR
ncbi:MAG: hypothetical protein L6Q99_22520 [Planctomycetes bacterium]|nr:hypothetical protein [Planctomycetota bacterium]